MAFRECDYATYFHGPEWTAIWSRFRGNRVAAAAQRVTFSDGLTAIIPGAMNERARGLLNTLTTCMEGTFGGWISTDPIGLEHSLCLTDHLLEARRGNVAWRVSPYAPFSAEVLERIRTRTATMDMSGTKLEKLLRCAATFRSPLQIPDDTHAVDLTPGFGALYGSQSSITRKAKKARKAGISIRLAETLDDWKQYYTLYEASLQRWRSDPGSAYDWELFRQLFEMRSPSVKLWIATLASENDRVISGALCFYAKRHVVYWHGSSLEQYFELRPVNLLMYEIIKDCCERGYAWYDFNPSGHLQGVIAFKESFGAKALPSPLVYVDTPLKRTARGVLLGLKGYL